MIVGDDDNDNDDDDGYDDNDGDDGDHDLVCTSRVYHYILYQNNGLFLHRVYMVLTTIFNAHRYG